VKEIAVALVSLGCAKNLVDSEVMLGLLKEEGFTLTIDTEAADVVVVNTCGFIDAAKQESINTILELAKLKENRCRLLLAAGCLAQRYGEELLARMPELDGLVGTRDTGAIAGAVKKALSGQKPVYTGGEHPAAEDAPRLLATPGHTAFLKVAEGCDNNCSYCAIPAIRGPYRSRKLSVLVTEAAGLAARGVRELNLVAQDITLYGTDLAGRRQLAPLLKELAALDGIAWIRLLYAYPERVDTELMALMAAEKKVCNYLDLPLQHADNRILAGMGRRLTREAAFSLLAELRRNVPGIVLRSSFIIGFPGEGEKEFANLLDFLSAARLERAGFFAYSREEGTPACSFRGQVPEKIRQERLRRALAVQSQIMEEQSRALKGKILPVMLDGPSAQDPRVTLGRTEGHAPEVDGYVRVAGRHGPPGRIVQAVISGADGRDLLADALP
jgi:ribosomal protein S12 methylthiotransferase